MDNVLLKNDSQDPTAPGQCAKLALGGRTLQSAKFASRVEQLRAASIVELCSGTQHVNPARCWLAVPAQVRNQMLAASVSAASYDDWNTESEAAALPLVRSCRRAQDERPAKCLLLWLEISRTLNKRDGQDALDIASVLCRNFGGQVDALKQCMKQVAPHLRIGAGSEIATFQFCQGIRDGKNLRAAVQCASKLGRRHIAPSIIAQVCAETLSVSEAQPHHCFLEAQQKLRWMDLAAQVSLCKDSPAPAATVPVSCAMEMKRASRSLLPSGFSSEPLGVLVASLCHGAANATIVLECVRLLPVRAFTADQAVRLCAASSMPTKLSDNEGFVSLYPTSCASQARSILQRALLVDGSNDLGMSASAAAVQVCEAATSHAPSKCLADTQHDQALSARLWVQLCQHATSNAPQLCVKSLRKFVNSQRLDIYAAVAACQQAEYLGPADCVTELFQVAPGVSGKVAAQLCHAAKNSGPARCFSAAPFVYDDVLKISLCMLAENTAPALCAESVITRLANQPSVKVALCRGATTSAPVACASEAPLGMDEANLVILCRLATSIAPARCAQEVPTFLRVPWNQVALVCAGARSSTPGHCLAHHTRHSRLLLRTLDATQIVTECRLAVAQASTLGLAKSSYNCPELRSWCPLQLVVNVLDQYGDVMPETYLQEQRSSSIMYVSGVYTGAYDQERNYIGRGQPTLEGPTYAAIINGSATFSNLLFTAAGEFILTFRTGGRVTEEVVRVVVHPDKAADALQNRCEELFKHFQCSIQLPTQNDQNHEMQTLLLHRVFYFNAISCEQYWIDNIGGPSFVCFSARNDALYALPRLLYYLITYEGYERPLFLLSLLTVQMHFRNSNVPRADMSAWDLLGLREGETNRGAIRRAYHRRSLEWHPDKWHSMAAALPSPWQQELANVYVLITQAYVQLSNTVAFEL
ncbi:unnamed protein product [Phytophthora fragariaefolia]|uniref:Unnamed protein product n=1 Tax=Phytophthora fragariaefolia TaxID=1490495 RepID=A0A9W6U6F2_9STRA|nr:unnamed protein product [Phytophthora fragariaefolia]